ncbi:Indole-3-acetaldehyde oxidase [Hibiscus syriacus]|uniref:indole-3-acetaldehyde oxidase n=1 Tax=Hibiscus syriacus TaxID=106335 RepID=A0A6A3AP62_HIBSY|nr:Indole-3-acetaldehyde oxidase [Hibiscus syriacus]
MDITTKQSLVFSVNGHRFEMCNVDPSMTLLEFLRYQTHFKSVKLSCGEGGCGACVVLLSKYDSVSDKVEDFTVSSCLTLLGSVNGCSITTAEGIGNSKDGFHPIQERFSGFHASQCGFCTPGMCVSLYAALVDAEKTKNRAEPRPGLSKLTVSEAEKSIAGNLCRCTGYRPIVDVCKSFASDVDMEDLGFNSFWRKGESNEVKLSRLPRFDRNDAIRVFPEFLEKEATAGANMDSQRCHWYSPVSLEELQSLLHMGTSVKIIVGNTGTGYYKELVHYDNYIDLRYIPELSVIRKDPTGIEIGAAVTISKAIETLKEENEGEFGKEGKMVFEKLGDHMEKIASRFIRNSGSVGGNLMMAQRKHFPSDIATILLSVDTIVEVITSQSRLKLTLEEFLGRPSLDSETVLLSIKIPCWEPSTSVSSDAGNKLLFETYRAAPRPLGNALPYLNAAFLAQVSQSPTGFMLKSCRFVFGAYGTKHAIRVKEVEDFLNGKLLSSSVLYEAVTFLETLVVPEDGTSTPAYRSSLAVGFLFEFLSPLIDSEHERFGKTDCPTLLSSSNQKIRFKNEYYPVGEPVTKTGAILQASGEAIYVDDIPSPKDCLYGAFIYSSEPRARVKGIKFDPDSSPDGVVSLITCKDIPGLNLGGITIFGTEPLYADELTEGVGQRIAFVVADSQKNADIAANLVVVEYDKENLEPPILSVEEAVERCSFYKVPPSFYPEQIKLGSQYYFYMETQTSLAIPDEDDCMVVYSSTQYPEFAHNTIAACLGVPGHNVRVKTRRLGGGFGGKSVKSMAVASACAVAAYRLHSPVRVYVNRKFDMIMSGGRHPMKITYSVGCKSNGKITALKLDILIDAGMFVDESPIMPSYMLGSLRKYDWGALSFDIKLCKTNLPSRGAVRAPGNLQASYIAEAVIEHVASYLSMEVDSVRNINLHTYNSLNFFFPSSAGEPLEYTLPSIWERLATTSSFYDRTNMVQEFNRCHKWKKRGISRVPIVYEVMMRPTPGKVSILRDGSIVVEVGGIEMGQGLWTKVKQMAAYGLGLVKCGGSRDLLEKVRVIETDTLSVIQGGLTAGSTTSEASCEAVRLCCNILVERLIPLKEKLMEKVGPVEWEALIVEVAISTSLTFPDKIIITVSYFFSGMQAYDKSVNLSASALYMPNFSTTQYINYGAAVEVSLITGETTILRTDIIYDCGQSLNPAVDLGQIEGAYVQGIGFFMLEEYLTNSDGLVITDNTWTYKIPTVDTIPKQFNVEILNSGHHKDPSGEPPLTLAVSVHCATRAAVREARQQVLSWGGEKEAGSTLIQMEVPATMPVVKELCGLDSVQKYLQWAFGKNLG